MRKKKISWRLAMMKSLFACGVFIWRDVPQALKAVKQMSCKSQSNMPKSQKFLGVVSALWGLVAIALGAYIHHGTNLTDPAMASLETALLYNLVFAAITFLMVDKLAAKSLWFILSAWMFLVGSFIFCASLYSKYLLDLEALGSFAPWGGIIIMLGWLMASVGFLAARYRTAD